MEHTTTIPNPEALIARASVFEAGDAGQEFKGFNLDDLTPTEIVGLFRHLDQAWSVVPTQPAFKQYDDPAHNLLRNQVNALHQCLVSEHVNNPERGHLIYTALASSPRVRDRWQAAKDVHLITKSDHDFGLELWEALLADPDPAVKATAYYMLNRSFNVCGGTRAELSRHLGNKYGITWLEALHLADIYAQALAEENRNLRAAKSKVVGRTALSRAWKRLTSLDCLSANKK